MLPTTVRLLIRCAALSTRRRRAFLVLTLPGFCACACANRYQSFRSSDVIAQDEILSLLPGVGHTGPRPFNSGWYRGLRGLAGAVSYTALLRTWTPLTHHEAPLSMRAAAATVRAHSFNLSTHALRCTPFRSTAYKASLSDICLLVCMVNGWCCACSCCCVTDGRAVQSRSYHAMWSFRCSSAATGIGSEIAGGFSSRSLPSQFPLHERTRACALCVALRPTRAFALSTPPCSEHAVARACPFFVLRSRPPGMMERLTGGGGGSAQVFEQQQYEDPSRPGGLRAPDTSLGREKKTCCVM